MPRAKAGGTFPIPFRVARKGFSDVAKEFDVDAMRCNVNAKGFDDDAMLSEEMEMTSEDVEMFPEDMGTSDVT